MLESTPFALGKDLTQAPFAHVLISALKLKATGRLAVRHARGEDQIYFKAGVPAGSKVMHSFVPLGRFLLDLGWIKEADLEASVAEMDQRQRQGDALVQIGALTQEKLVEGLKLHEQRNLVEIAKLQEGQLAFRADPTPPPWAADVALNALRILRAVLEVPNSEAVCDTLFAKIGRDAPIVIPPHLLPTIAAFELDEAERQAARLLESPITLKQFLARVRIPEQKARALAAELIVTNLLVSPEKAVPVGEKLAPKADDKDRDRRRRLLGRAFANVRGGAFVRAPTYTGAAVQQPPSPTPTATPSEPAPFESYDLPRLVAPAPPAASAEDQALRALISEKAKLVPTLDHYGKLGINQAATKDQIKTAFVQAARIFHPDHLPPSLSDLAQAQRDIFTAVKEAYDTLLDDSRAREYRANLQAAKGSGATPATIAKAGGSTVVQRAREEEARQAAERGDQALRKRDYATATESFHQAHELAPQGDYLASEAWSLFSDPARKKEQKKARDLLESAVQKYPEAERVAHYRGVLARLDGQTDEAESWLRRAVAINPKNLDAANELHLIQMRKKVKSK